MNAQELLAGILAASLAMTGCTHSSVVADGRGENPDTRLSDRSREILETRVLRLTRPEATDTLAIGSAVLLDDGRVVTALHCLSSLCHGDGLQFKVDGEWHKISNFWENGYELNGRPVALRLESRGGGDPHVTSGDWAICLVKPEEGEWIAPGKSSDIEILPGAMPLEGTPIWMVGFWNPERDVLPNHPTFTPGRIAQHDNLRLPENVMDIDGVGPVLKLNGDSGGAVARIEPDGSVVIVGIFRGMRTSEWLGIRVAGSYRAVVVPPLEQ